MMKPIATLQGRDDVQKAKKAHQNMLEKRMEAANKSHALRNKIDSISEELTEAYVQLEMGETDQPAVDKLEQAHEDAQIALIEHEKRIEPLDKAAKRLEANYNEVIQNAISEERPKVAQEYKKRVQSLIEAMENLEQASNHVKAVNHGLHNALTMSTSDIQFHQIQMDVNGTQWNHYKHKLNNIVK